MGEGIDVKNLQLYVSLDVGVIDPPPSEWPDKKRGVLVMFCFCFWAPLAKSDNEKAQNSAKYRTPSLITPKSSQPTTRR